MDPRYKRTLIGQNTYACKFGQLKNKSNYTCMKNQYRDNYTTGVVYNFCDVYILKVPAIDIANEFIRMGLTPVLVTNITNDFKDNNIDSLEGVYDDTTLIRTNYNIIMRTNSNFLPLHDNEILYTPEVIILRDENMNFYTNELNKISIITNNLNRKDYKFGKKRFNFDSYFNLKIKLENIFQTAHMSGHDVLILNDFGISTNLFPIKEIIDLYNLCILKYGHLFKYIIFPFSIKDSRDIASHAVFLKDIIKPQEILDPDDEHNQELINIQAQLLLKTIESDNNNYNEATV